MLLTAQPFQGAFRTFRALGLERLMQPGVTPPDVHRLSPRKLQAIRGGGKVIDTTVNANDVAVLWREGYFPVHDDVDGERFRLLVVTEGGRSGFLPYQELALGVADGQGKLEPARHRGDGNFPALFIEGESALVEAHARGFELLRFRWLSLIPGRFGYTGDSADDEVSPEIVLFFDGVIAEVLELDLVGGAVFLSDAEDVIAGVSKPPQGLSQGFSLFGINLEFAPCCFRYKLHSFMLRTAFEKGVNRAFLPRLKSRASGTEKMGELGASPVENSTGDTWEETPEVPVRNLRKTGVKKNHGLQRTFRCFQEALRLFTGFLLIPSFGGTLEGPKPPSDSSEPMAIIGYTLSFFLSRGGEKNFWENLCRGKAPLS